MTPITRYLLQSLLEVIPPFTELEPYRDFNLNIWRMSGAYRAVSVNNKGFTLAVTNVREYSRALFSDAQHLINHVAEHRAHILNSVSTGRENSPTWLFVTVYYMALYAAMAFTRAANSAVVYLDRDAIIEFCGSSTGLPGAGAFTISMDSKKNEIKITKHSRSHFHEAVWTNSIDELKSIHSWISVQSKSRGPSLDELLHIRSLNLFIKSNFLNGHTWPSKLRNALNYRPGFSYRSVVRNNFLTITSKLLKSRFSSLEEVINFGENMQNKLINASDSLTLPNESVDLLMCYALILESYSDEAFQGVCDVQNLTSSARMLRRKFNRTHCTEPGSILMPV